MQKDVVNAPVQNNWSTVRLDSSQERKNESLGWDCSEEMQWEQQVLL